MILAKVVMRCDLATCRIFKSVLVLINSGHEYRENSYISRAKTNPVKEL